MIGGEKNITNPYYKLLPVKLTFHLSCLFPKIWISPFYFYFISSNLELLKLHFIPHISQINLLNFMEF